MRGGGMRNSFAATNPGVMRNATINRSFGPTVGSGRYVRGWNGHGHRGWRHRGWGYGVPLAFGYGYYGGYYDDYPYDYAYYGDGYYGDSYYGDYAYNDSCYRVTRYHTRTGWHARTVNVCD